MVCKTSTSTSTHFETEGSIPVWCMVGLPWVYENTLNSRMACGPDVAHT